MVRRWAKGMGKGRGERWMTRVGFCGREEVRLREEGRDSVREKVGLAEVVGMDERGERIGKGGCWREGSAEGVRGQGGGRGLRGGEGSVSILGANRRCNNAWRTRPL